jgi:tRNA-Thr(GGU) m(6)t(6)A37 methyltransferase TsaA
VDGVSIASKLRSMIAGRPAPIPVEPVTYRPIGVVRTRVREPRPGNWQETRSDIVLADAFTGALDGIDGFSHLIVVFDIDRVPQEERRLRVVTGTDSLERGVLATRSQLRPNPIGVSVVQLLALSPGCLQVRGLDAIDGTPVLDVKPYLPQFDSVAGASLPDWAQRPTAAP